MTQVNCTGCHSDQTEQMQANHDDYVAYRCHCCGDMFQIIPDTFEYITAPVDKERILFEEEMHADLGGLSQEEYFLEEINSTVSTSLPDDPFMHVPYFDVATKSWA